jgi:hypothetical protein
VSKNLIEKEFFEDPKQFLLDDKSLNYDRLECEILLNKFGVVHLPAALNVTKLKAIAEVCDRTFAHIEQLIRQHGSDHVKEYLPKSYGYLERSTSISPIALDGDLNASAELLDMFVNSLGMELVVGVLGRDLACNLTKSRVARQYALKNYHALHIANQWHQDGALGIRFPERASLNSQYIDTAMTPMVTCWIPLVDCLGDRPSLEFIKQPLQKLLHYEFLSDRKLAKLFDPSDFWVPELKLGDMLIFLNGTLHRTYVMKAMGCDRTSIELRFMPTSQIPEWMRCDRFAGFKNEDGKMKIEK